MVDIAVVAPPLLRHVGTRTAEMIGETSSLYSQMNTNSRHVLPIACRNLRIVYPNWFVQSGVGEVDATNDIAVLRAGLQPTYSVGAAQRVRFGGANQIALGAGGEIMSDTIGRRFAAGSVIGLRSFLDMGSAKPFVIGRTTLPGLAEGVEFGTALTDKSISGAVSTDAGSALVPFLILGEPEDLSKRSVAIIGDSIPTGTGDTADATTGVIGYVERGLGVAVPNTKYTRGSDMLRYWAARRYSRMSTLTRRGYFTDVIIELGVNDFNTGRTLSQMQADFGTILTELLAAGLRVSACTITPITTSSDGWVTTGNQAVTANESVRVAFNNWLRAGVAGISKLYEIADLAETGRNSGIWKAGYTIDGTHPNATSSPVLATAITPADFGY